MKSQTIKAGKARMVRFQTEGRPVWTYETLSIPYPGGRWSETVTRAGVCGSRRFNR